ncbi:MAG: plastocyanin/azurin family copper-binding protein [bacterium]
MRVLAVAAFVAAMTLAGCSGNSDQSSTTTTSPTSSSGGMDHMMAMTYQVSMQGNAFGNTSLTVMSGDVVVWTHNDPATTAHTVTSDTGAPEGFDSNPNCAGPIPVNQGPPADICMTSGKTYSHTFMKEGSYGIHCKIHGQMKMTVIVAAMNMTM